MTPDDPCRNSIERELSTLPRYEPQPRRAERIRARGHAALRRRAQTRQASVSIAFRPHHAPAAAALAAGGGLVYVSLVLRLALRFCGF